MGTPPYVSGDGQPLVCLVVARQLRTDALAEPDLDLFDHTGDFMADVRYAVRGGTASGPVPAKGAGTQATTPAQTLTYVLCLERPKNRLVQSHGSLLRRLTGRRADRPPGGVLA